MRKNKNEKMLSEITLRAYEQKEPPIPPQQLFDIGWLIGHICSLQVEIAKLKVALEEEKR